LKRLWRPHDHDPAALAIVRQQADRKEWLMLKQEENELLTRTGPGTPCGELLRRYWQPLCFAGELTQERPAKRVKIMNEELVVYRDGDGNYGCLQERCVHRGASLAYGFVEKTGIRCAYHGWKFDGTGRCLVQPFEPPGSTYRDRVSQKAYPVESLGGILWVYMGPQPAPLVPRWDILVWTDGFRKLMRQEDLNCNWLQIQENSADVTHTYFLHAHQMWLRGTRHRGIERLYRPFKRYGFQPFEWGLIKTWQYDAGKTFPAETGAGNPLLFPNMLRDTEYYGGVPWHAMHWRIPIDDTRTRVLWAGFSIGEPASAHDLEWPQIEDHPSQMTADGEYAMDSFWSQDKMAWETQGEIMDRANEHLGASDRGIVLYRQMLRQEIEKVSRGEEPMALVRDPERNKIIELPAWAIEVSGDREQWAAASGMSRAGTPLSDVLDERLQWFDVSVSPAGHFDEAPA
jgi:5,5'-dehydrodivanillate O-demethylase oxygenase subunit